MTQSYALSHIKASYRAIFTEAKDSLLDLLNGLQVQFACPQCEALGTIPQLTEPLHAGCGFRGWQEAALNTIRSEVAPDILKRVQAIQAYKDTVSCHQCGVCCRLASSEYSYDELIEKSNAGDSFAQQFTSIFLPYSSLDAVHKKFPAIVDAVMAQVEPSPESSEKPPVYFYHCPYIGEDNRCTIYGTSKRPAICASYPDTPLTFIYEKCAWRPWKDETHTDALLAHALIELCSFLQGQLQDALATSSERTRTSGSVSPQSG